MGWLSNSDEGTPSWRLLCSNYLCFCSLCSELWRRIRMEFTVEWPLFKTRWKIVLFGLIMQYMHGVFTQLAHRMHKPASEPLIDVGFELTPELGAEYHWVSESVFAFMFVSFILWTFSPFVFSRKRFYTAILWSRILMVLVACQALRIISFTVTSLPGPSFHCRMGSPTATKTWPTHWSQHILMDIGQQATKSCGDLIFSSHTTFVLTGVLTYTTYGTHVAIKILAWALSGVLSFLIICSRKHYTVDVVIAWYTVPLMYSFMYNRWTTQRPVNEDEGPRVLCERDDVERDTDVINDQVIVLVERSKDQSGKDGHKHDSRNGYLALDVVNPLLPSGGKYQNRGLGSGDNFSLGTGTRPRSNAGTSDSIRMDTERRNDRSPPNTCNIS